MYILAYMNVPDASGIHNFCLKKLLFSVIFFVMLYMILMFKSWEKTMDCHSPGQGLMPASFKVRTVPLDGDDCAMEEVLDPDFGEAAIGRVAPVDSGMRFSLLINFFLEEIIVSSNWCIFLLIIYC